MKRNRLFDKIIKECMDDTEITGANDSDCELQVTTDFHNSPLEQIFSDVLNAAAKENTLTYSNLSVSKKSIPYSNM